jgi:hypothetical protein
MKMSVGTAAYPAKCVLDFGLILSFFLLALIPLSAIEPPAGAQTFDDNGDGRIDHWEFRNERGGISIYLDTKGQGKITYIIEHDDRAYRLREALDYNGDGELDDFYFYSNDVLIRREIDTNYDGRIDVWVYIVEGVYVQRYERDTNIDGAPDQIKVFGQ